MKTALITGITGQDGKYLAKFLIEKGYRIIGMVRSTGEINYTGFDYLDITNQVIFENCDLHDLTQIISLFKKYQPDEVYNLAAQSSVGQSFSQPIGTIQFNIISVLNLLEAIKIIGYPTRFYQASSSEMYGKVSSLPINENTPMHPLSPYAVSKASAHWITTNYREAYRLYNCCGVLFNHESFLRKPSFFVKKVILGAIDIKYRNNEKLFVGNINLKRDFGFAPKYVEAMWLMMQQDKPADYLICSGESVSLKFIIEYIFDRLGLSMQCVEVLPSLLRPTEIEDIYGDNTKAKSELGWDYHYRFSDVLDILLQEELKFQKLIDK
ncbi:MAG: GDP-mannose 4,6-dehydratase [Niastella sp.]|nr:GDP-mannose 4,6-dehydratase [Niastella sp.]